MVGGNLELVDGNLHLSAARSAAGDYGRITLLYVAE